MAFTFRWVPTPGQNNNFVNGSIYGGKARAILDDGQIDPFDSPLYICIPPSTFAGGNGSAATLLDFARLLGTCAIPRTTAANPARNYNGNILPTGGALTINGNACGNYEFNILPGGTSLSQADVATLFTSTQDISTWIVVQGNLTINAATVLIPTVNPSYTSPSSSYEYPPDPNAKRKLFMVVYAKGNLIFGDSASLISMSGCGADTSSTGANISSFNIPIANNLYYSSSLVSPSIQSVGAAGGAAVTAANGNSGDNGTISLDGSQLYTGGGGSGAQSAGTTFSGAGGSGSPFSGGTGGGGASKGGTAATAGSSLGGAGGNAGGGNNNGGTGNPGGSGSGSGVSGLTGTGGILIVISEGSIIVNSASVRANGVNAVGSSGPGGGASGGGIIAVMQNSSGGSFPSSSFTGGYSSGSTGGKGGNGTGYNYGINS